MLVAREKMSAEAFRRSGATWTDASQVGADASIERERPACRLRVGDLYAGITGRR